MAGEDIKDFTVMKFNKKLREEEKRDFNKNFISGNTDYEEKIDLLNRMRRTSTSWAVRKSTRASGAILHEVISRRRCCRAGSVERRGTDTATPSSRERAVHLMSTQVVEGRQGEPPARREDAQEGAGHCRKGRWEGRGAGV